ncbi:MAG: undecaprenyl/decaprenyl-phosphate alpha-N-acetylglucosaminyl 1-phosphate transferase [Lentisphaeria bacterium]|nr:undecaprenyl/decaprenyl-phosphate alpha-N-acetylglucosaminyl 1-phosphate transferase [Lentisphaeria bacterium]
MPDRTQIYAAVFIVALGFSLLLTPLFRIIARKTSFLDIPRCEKHKLHENATPLLGGAAMFSAWILTALSGFLAVKFFLPEAVERNLASDILGIHWVAGDFAVIGLCAFASLVLGLIDDKRPLKAGTKFLGQLVIAAVTALFSNTRISLFVGIPGFSVILTIFWFLFIFNSINFFDNMDGLAAGTATIAFTFFTAAAIWNGQYFVASLGASLAGSVLGFWFFNHAPASIFMGDGGSHFLGYMLALISAKTTYYTPGVSASRMNILIPVFILAVPIFDTIAVMIIRIMNGKPVYVGDHNHISHRFYHMGMTRKRAVLLVHILGLISGLGAMPLLWGDRKSCLILLFQGLAILLLLTLLQHFGKTSPEAPQELPAENPPEGPVTDTDKQ